MTKRLFQFMSRMTVAKYSMRYSPPSNRFGEKLSFFEITLEAPFSRASAAPKPNDAVFRQDDSTEVSFWLNK